jgi:hypothetical protein
VTDAWYLRAEDYYAAPDDASEHPWRQGDVFGEITVGSDHWQACQLVHPTCEVGKPSVAELQVVRVHAISEVSPSDQARITVGSQEKDGRLVVAFAHTFFLAPVSTQADVPLFANLRDVAQVSKEQLQQASRLAALTQDCRVRFIRRKLYFRYRMLFSVQQVQDWEAMRIAADPTFNGPRPTWPVPPVEPP